MQPSDERPVTVDDVSIALEEIEALARLASDYGNEQMQPLLGAIERLTINARQMVNHIPAGGDS